MHLKLQLDLDRFLLVWVPYAATHLNSSWHAMPSPLHILWLHLCHTSCIHPHLPSSQPCASQVHVCELAHVLNFWQLCREVQRILMQLLNQVDGFDQTVNMKVIMATNRADTLDPALLRPGRLDRKIEFPLPDRRQKRLVFQVCYHF